jgi:hypothetical protein
MREYARRPSSKPTGFPTTSPTAAADLKFGIDSATYGPDAESLIRFEPGSGNGVDTGRLQIRYCTENGWTGDDPYYISESESDWDISSRHCRVRRDDDDYDDDDHYHRWIVGNNVDWGSVCAFDQHDIAANKEYRLQYYDYDYYYTHQSRYDYYYDDLRMSGNGAMIACRQMGFAAGGVMAAASSWGAPYATSNISMFMTHCYGDEDVLQQCDHESRYHTPMEGRYSHDYEYNADDDDHHMGKNWLKTHGESAPSAVISPYTFTNLCLALGSWFPSTSESPAEARYQQCKT